MRAKRARLVGIFQQFEIIRKRIKLREMAPFANQQVPRIVVNARKLIDDVADVSAQAVIAGATNINGHAHSCFY